MKIYNTIIEGSLGTRLFYGCVAVCVVLWRIRLQIIDLIYNYIMFYLFNSESIEKSLNLALESSIYSCVTCCSCCGCCCCDCCCCCCCGVFVVGSIFISLLRGLRKNFVLIWNFCGLLFVYCVCGVIVGVVDVAATMEVAAVGAVALVVAVATVR